MRYRRRSEAKEDLISACKQVPGIMGVAMSMGVWRRVCSRETADYTCPNSGRRC